MNNAKLSIWGFVQNSVTKPFERAKQLMKTLPVIFILFVSGSLPSNIPFELALKINVRKLNLHLNLAALLTHESSLI